MPITLDVSGTNMVIKVLRGPGWEAERDLIKKLPGRMPIYKLNLEGVSAFSHWEVPLAEFGNLLSVIDKSQILLSSDKAKSLMNKFLLSTTGLQELPPFDGEIAWKRPPRYPEQEQYIRLSKDKDRVILALSPGLGKSNCSLLRASIFQPKRVLVVGPSKNNFTTWRSEVEKSTNWTIIKYHGSPQKRKKLRESGELLKFDVVYTTYTVLHELVDIPFDQIIYDEAHTICNSKTKNAKNAKKIVNKNPEAGLQLLSGTPIQHKPKDLWFLVHLINPQIAGDEWAWGKKYEKVLETMKRRIPLKSGGEYLKDDSGKVLTKLIEIPIKTCAQNLDHLVDRVKSIMFRLKRDKYVNFEERVDFEYVEMTPAQKKMYKEAREELFLELSTGQLKLSQEKLGRITRFLQICEGCFNLDPNMQDSGKLEYLFDELDAAQDKVIVWSRFKPITEILHAKYKNRSVIYNGDYGQNHKDVAILNFQGAETKQDMADWERLNKAKFSKPGEAQFFFGTMDKGTTAGLNLDACYRQYIPSFPWNGNTLEQTCARIKRLNQQASEVFTTLIVTESPNNFEEQALQLVLKNYATTLQILDGEGDVTYNQVQDLLKLLK